MEQEEDAEQFVCSAYALLSRTHLPRRPVSAPSALTVGQWKLYSVKILLLN